MTIRHLKVFISVCETGNMTKTAKELHIAQPAVSYTIKELENYASAKLFERINQRLIITDFARELLPKAKEAVASFEEFEAMTMKRGKNTAVKIGASITIGRTIIPKLISDIKTLFPDISPFVSINSVSKISEEVQSGKLDFALIEGKPNSTSLQATELSGDKLIAVCRNDFNAPKKCSVKELASFPLLLREVGGVSRELMDNLFAEKKLTLQPFIESSSNDALLSAARSGLGIVILPSVLLENLLESGEFKEIEISDASLERKYYLIKNKTKEFSRPVEKIYEIFAKENENSI